jgi:hypothetical protein
MSKRNLAEVWNHYKRDGDTATCNKCMKKITCKGSTTTPMINHLKLIHSIILKEYDSGESSNKKAKFETVPSVLNYLKRQELDEIVSRLVAEDGITVNTITKSSFIRESISSRGYSLPTHPSSNMKLVISFFNKIKIQQIKTISDAKKYNKRFSLTLDEWTSLANKRFFNINLHSKSFHINLGLLRIPGKCDALETKILVSKRLAEYNIDLGADIVSSTSDGAPVMVKFGKESPAEFNLCFNHGIHLAVLDVLYKKNENPGKHINKNDSESDEENFEDNFNYSDDELLKQIAMMNLLFYLKIMKRQSKKHDMLQNFLKCRL